MSPSSSARVAADECISPDEMAGLPYLKHVELTKYSPSHFGLEKWTRLFVIPDHWMRKIYKDEVWRDTDLPEPETEKLTKEQKRTLYKWLLCYSPFKDEYPGAKSERKSRSSFSQCEDLVNLLELTQETTESDDENEEEDDEDDDSCDTTELLIANGKSEEIEENNHDNQTARIAVCYGHKIQPEYAIARKATDKMRYLSDEEEALFQSLIADPDFMEILDQNIRLYLEEQKLCSC